MWSHNYAQEEYCVRVCCCSALAAFTPPWFPQYGDFDRYVLALSWQTGFCQSQHDRNRKEPLECQQPKEAANKADYLTVHGLWPGLPGLPPLAASIITAGCVLVARRGLFNMPEAKAGKKCAAEETGLSLEVANKLNQVMPGSGGKPALSVMNTPSMVSVLVLTPIFISTPWSV
jgi:ribonuclease I